MISYLCIRAAVDVPHSDRSQHVLEASRSQIFPHLSEWHQRIQHRSNSKVCFSARTQKVAEQDQNLSDRIHFKLERNYLPQDRSWVNYTQVECLCIIFIIFCGKSKSLIRQKMVYSVRDVQKNTLDHFTCNSIVTEDRNRSRFRLNWNLRWVMNRFN